MASVTNKMSETYGKVFKLLLLGDSNVGKTALANRYCDDVFSPSTMGTIGSYTINKKRNELHIDMLKKKMYKLGIDFKVKHIFLNGERIKLQLW